METLLTVMQRHKREEVVQLVQRLIAEHPTWNRTRLSQELCAVLNWRGVDGGLKEIACRSFLLKLERRGEIGLPPRQHKSVNAFGNRSPASVRYSPKTPYPKTRPSLPTANQQQGRPKEAMRKISFIRLREHQKEALAFLCDFRAPFDNNLAEGDLRTVKGRQKISGTFRSEKGGSDFCRILSYISTVRKHALNVIDALQSVFAGAALLPSLDSS